MCLPFPETTVCKKETAPLFVYMSFPDEESAARAGRFLVEEHLAAGVNLFPGMRSLYWWQGQVHQKNECVVIVQSTQGAFDRLVARVTALHPYQVPSITAFSPAAIHAPFAAWITSETHPLP